MISLYTTNLATECVCLSSFDSIFSICVCLLCPVNVQMSKMIKSFIDKSICPQNEHNASNHVRCLKSSNIKQFHKINFYFVERTVLQACSEPIEFLHVPSMLNGCIFFKATKCESNAFKSAVMMDTFLPEHFLGPKMGTMD